MYTFSTFVNSIVLLLVLSWDNIYNCKSAGSRSQFHPRPHHNPLQQHSPRTLASQSSTTGQELSSELVFLIALCGK